VLAVALPLTTPRNGGFFCICFDLPLGCLLAQALCADFEGVGLSSASASTVARYFFENEVETLADLGMLDKSDVDAAIAHLGLKLKSAALLRKAYEAQRSPQPSSQRSAQPAPKGAAEASPLNVREEPWYARFYHGVVENINNTSRKKEACRIMIIGVEGDLNYGARTRQEWTYLIEDIDAQVKAGTIRTRPESQRLPFEFFEKRVEELASSGEFHVLVASCPSRLGDNSKVMEEVEAMVTGKKWSMNVDIVFSRAGNASSALFTNF
jgi:hypothetical protein